MVAYCKIYISLRFRRSEIKPSCRLDLEKIDFHHNVRNTFLSLASKYKDRYVVIDASQPYEAVVNEVYNIIKQRLTNGN